MADDVLFGRICRLTIAVPVPTPGDYAQTTSDVITIGGGDATEPGLRVRFKVTRTSESNPNTAEITVTNLSLSSRGRLQGKGVRVLLEAGYAASGYSRLHVGDARTIDHNRERTDWQTVIKSGDGERSYRFARASQSFAGGTSAADVLVYLGQAMGLGTGNVATQAPLLGVTFDQGYAVHGPAAKALDTLTASLGYSWSIQDGELQVLAVDQALDLQIPDIGPDSGLIGSPEMGTPDTQGKPALITFKSLLVPTKPGAKVRLRSARYDGELRVVRCTYDGDTHGGPWFTEIQGVALGR